MSPYPLYIIAIYSCSSNMISIVSIFKFESDYISLYFQKIYKLIFIFILGISHFNISCLILLNIGNLNNLNNLNYLKLKI